MKNDEINIDSLIEEKIQNINNSNYFCRFIENGAGMPISNLFLPIMILKTL